MNEYDRQLLKLRLRRAVSSRAVPIAIAVLGLLTAAAAMWQDFSTPSRSVGAEFFDSEGLLAADKTASPESKPNFFDLPAKYREKLLAPAPPQARQSDRALPPVSIPSTPRPIQPFFAMPRRASNRPAPSQEVLAPAFQSRSKRNAKFNLPAAAPESAPVPTPESAPAPTPESAPPETPELRLSLADTLALALARTADSKQAILATTTAPERRDRRTVVKLGKEMAIAIPATAGTHLNPDLAPAALAANPDFHSLERHLLADLEDSDEEQELTAKWNAAAQSLAQRQALEAIAVEVGIAYRQLLKAQGRVLLATAALAHVRDPEITAALEAKLAQAKTALKEEQGELAERLQLDRAVRIIAATPPAFPQAVELRPAEREAIAQFMLANRPDYLQSQLALARAEFAEPRPQREAKTDSSKTAPGDEGHSPSDLAAENQRILHERLQGELAERFQELELGRQYLLFAREQREQVEATPEGQFADRLSAQQTELEAALNYLDAIARLDFTTGNTLNRWGVAIDAEP